METWQIWFAVALLGVGFLALLWGMSLGDELGRRKGYDQGFSDGKREGTIEVTSRLVSAASVAGDVCDSTGRGPTNGRPS